jgi:hypothetical protein
MVAGFAEMMESEEILIAGACNHPEFASLAVPLGTDPARSATNK